MNSDEQKLQKLQKLFELVDTDRASTDEVAKLFEVVINTINELDKQLNGEIASTAVDLTDKILSIKKQLEDEDALITGQVRLVKASLSTEIKALYGEINTAIDSVKQSIPTPTDLSEINQKISSIESTIYQLPEKLSVAQTKADILQINNEIVSLGESIKKLEEEIEKLKKIKTQTNFIGGGVIGRDLIKDIDISDQLDGVTETFNIAGVWNIISVNLSSFPYGSLRKGIDFTYTPTSITFTSQIDPGTQLAQGQSCVLTVVTA